jgi:4-amino-4-deoxy-L-arabinose transferase-like glycosyltransferase
MDDTQKTTSYSVAVAYFVLFALSFSLLFYHLDNHLLWGDEAETAVLAKNVVQFGVPQTFNGTNYILLHGKMDETPTHVWIWSPWMQDYLTASSFMLFGPSTWSARAPFALIGCCSLLLLGLTAFKIYRSHWVALGAVALLATSEVFLLHARQCRYYPISVFAEILLVYGAYELIASRPRGMWLIALALVIQFYSNYIIVAANLPVILCMVWFLRKQGRQAVFRIAAALGIWVLAALPWLLYAHPWGQSKAMGDENYLTKARDYLFDLHFFFIPLCFFLLPLIGFFSKDGKPEVPATIQRWEQFVLLLLALYLLTILSAPGIYLRYLLPLLPLMCLLAAAWIFRYVKWRVLAIGLLVVQMTSNFFPIISAFPFRNGHALRFPLVEYISGIMTPYTGRLDDELDFFKAHSRPGQTVLSFDPEFPLTFYAGLVVINGRIMAPNPGTLPDWFLPFPAAGVVAQPTVPLPDVYRPYYTPILVQIHNSYLSDSVPEPDLYKYRTPPGRTPYVIYELNTLTNEPASPR